MNIIFIIGAEVKDIYGISPIVSLLGRFFSHDAK